MPLSEFLLLPAFSDILGFFAGVGVALLVWNRLGKFRARRAERRGRRIGQSWWEDVFDEQEQAEVAGGLAAAWSEEVAVRNRELAEELAVLEAGGADVTTVGVADGEVGAIQFADGQMLVLPGAEYQDLVRLATFCRTTPMQLVEAVPDGLVWQLRFRGVGRQASVRAELVEVHQLGPL